MLSGVLNTLQGIISPEQIWLLKALIDRVTTAVQTSTSPELAGWLWAAAVIGISELVTMCAQSLSQAVVELLEH